MVMVTVLLCAVVRKLHFNEKVSCGLCCSMCSRVRGSDLRAGRRILFVSLYGLLVFLKVPCRNFVLLYDFVLVAYNVSFLGGRSRILLCSLPLFFLISLLTRGLVH